MTRILIVTGDRARFAPFAEGLARAPGVEVDWAETGSAALDRIKRHPTVAAVIDEELGDMPGLDLVRRMLPINAFICAAVVSELGHDAFHEAAEGLGIAEQLPGRPSAEDAAGFIERMRTLCAFNPAP